MGEFSQSIRKWSWFGSLSFTDPQAVVILPIEEAKQVVSIQYPFSLTYFLFVWPPRVSECVTCCLYSWSFNSSHSVLVVVIAPSLRQINPALSGLTLLSASS